MGEGGGRGFSSVERVSLPVRPKFQQAAFPPPKWSSSCWRATKWVKGKQSHKPIYDPYMGQYNREGTDMHIDIFFVNTDLNVLHDLIENPPTGQDGTGHC